MTARLNPILATLSLSLALTAAPAQKPNLLPLPSSLQASPGSLPVTAAFTTSLSGATSPRLERAIRRTLTRIEARTGLELSKQLPPGTTATLQINVHADGPAVQTLDEDESYHLAVTPTAIRLDAATTTGALHGLETLFQLIQPAGPAYTIPAVTIDDQPRFRWRGLMIDCGRHFEPLDVLKRNIDAMAAVKLNVFHWHLTEDQGFRIESKLYPKLTTLGSDGNFYTQQDARDLVAYARDRGIRVVPEFEMPGHSAAWLVAYPDLASGTNPSAIRTEFGISDFAIDPTREATYQFIERFLREMTTLFPDTYVHIGGDETPAPDWKQNPRILAFMKAHTLKDNDALQAYFNTRILAILTKLNRRMVGWDEIFNPALPKDVVIQSWRGEESLAKAAAEGYQGVLSAPYYLDGMRPAEIPYLADPVPADTRLTADQQKHILGGEVCMWAEQVDSVTIDSRIWPRTAAIAERFWSPQSLRDTDDMYRRLAPVSIELETLGLHHVSAQMTLLRDLFSTRHLDALRIVSQAFEPVSFGDRYEEQKTSQLTPLRGFVDALPPDPPSRHQVELATRQLLATPAAARASAPQAQELQAFYTQLAANLPQVRQQLATAPRAQVIGPRLDQLATLITIATQALHYLTTNTPAPADWKAASLATLESVKAPSAIIRFTFQAALTALVQAT